MTALRALLRARYLLALLLVALALAVRMLVPAGTMPASGSRVLTVQICADASGLPHSRAIVIPGKPDSQKGSAAKGHCAFAGLGTAALEAADPVLLAAALVFILLAGLALACPALPARIRRFHPPLRGPPAFT